MTASAPQIPKIVLLKLATVDYSQDVIDAEIVPTPGDVLKVTTLDGVVHQDVGTESWALRLNCIIDWDSTRPGLAYYLYTNKGQSVAFEYNAHGLGAESATQPKMTGTVRLVPLPYGGDGNVYAEAEVLLPISGTPLRDATP